MAITVSHQFVSAKPDGADSTLVQPSNWNADHSLTGTLPVTNGGTGAATAADARTNLGLGTIATQNSNNVTITGGTVSGVTLTSLDSSTTIQDNADPTKQMQFEVSGVTGGQTSVLTVPDTDGTLTLNDATQTLTNKTLTSPTITTSPTAAGATWTNLGSVTTADINGGTIDGTTIGGASAAAGTFTTLTATGNAALGDAEATDTHAIKGATTILSNSASAALTVTNTGSGNSFVVEDSASTDSTPFVIDASGNVVSGSTTAQTVAGGTPILQINSTTDSSLYDSLANFNWAVGTQAPSVILAKSRGGSVGTRTIVQNNDNTGTIRFYGDDGASFIRTAEVSSAVDGTPGTNDMPGRLVFSTTADGASSPTERYRIASDGKHTYAGYAALTNSTNNAAFTITNTGSGDSFVVEDSASTDSTPFVIDASGRAITGHTTSVSVLGTEAGLQNWSNSGYTNQGRFSNDSFSSWAIFVKSRNTSVGGQTIVQSGDELGNIAFTGSDGTAYIQGARIRCEVDGAPGTNDMPGRLVFSTTADGASTPTERMRIDSAGLVTLTAGQLKFPATQNASADANTLDDYREATFTATATGMTTSPTGTASFVRVGNDVTLTIPTITGTSNATSFTLTGMPTTCRPAATRTVVARVQDNGGAISFGRADIDSSGVITLYKDAASTAFTNSGTKSVNVLTVSYHI